MTYSLNYKIKSNALGFLFGNFQRIVLTNSYINIINNRKIKYRILINDLDIPILHKRKLGNSIELRFKVSA